MTSRRENDRVDILIKDAFIITMDQDRTVYTDGYLALDDGTILAVGRMEECSFTGQEEIDGSSFCVLPGMSSTHHHIVQTIHRGMADGRGVESYPKVYGFRRGSFLEYVYLAMGGAADEERSYHIARLAILEMLKGGVTATNDEHFTHLQKRSIDGICRAVQESGMWGLITRSLVSREEIIPPEFCEDVDMCIRETERLRATWNSDRLEVVTGPLGIGYCGHDDLVALKEFTRGQGCMYLLHLPAHADPPVLEARGWEGGSIQYLDHYGLLDSDILAGHGHSVLPEEYDLVADFGVKIGACPRESMGHGLGVPLMDYVERGVAVGLGFDGPTMNTGQNMWEEMKTALLGQGVSEALEGVPEFERRYLSPELALELATLGGARALRLDDRIGSLEAGKAADCVLVNARSLNLIPPARLVTNLVMAPNPAAVHTVILGGQIVVKDGKHLLWDEDEIVDTAIAIQRQMMEEVDTRKYAPAPGQRWRGWSYK